MNEPLSVFLLVDDNEDDAFFLQRAFRAAGLANPLHVVTNGEEAIAYLSGTNGFKDRKKYPFPDFIFLDLKMPGLNGFDVLRSIEREKRAEIHIAVLTSSAEESDRRRAQELGADCYLIKPPSVSTILSCCKQFGLTCERKRPREESA